jgi:plastocyanin
MRRSADDNPGDGVFRPSTLLAIGALALLGLTATLAILTQPAPAAGPSAVSAKAKAVKSAVRGKAVRNKAAKNKAVRKCRKIKSKKRRQTCLRQVNQRFRPPVRVDVRDDYFAPARVTVNAGRRIAWDWGTINGNSHNVMLDPISPQPRGLNRSDYFRLDSGRSPAINFRFTRDLTKTGTYNFYCSLHSTVMRMKVNVKR